MKMPDTVGMVRCTVHLTARRRLSFSVPMGWVQVQELRARRHKDGTGQATATVRCGLTWRVRLLVLAVRALVALQVRVDVEVN